MAPSTPGSRQRYVPVSAAEANDALSTMLLINEQHGQHLCLLTRYPRSSGVQYLLQYMAAAMKHSQDVAGNISDNIYVLSGETGWPTSKFGLAP